MSLHAWLFDRSPVLLGAASAVNIACALVLALDGVWWGVAFFAASAVLFAVAAVRFAKRRHGGQA